MSKLLEDLNSLRELLAYDMASPVIDSLPSDEIPENLTDVIPEPEATDDGIPLLDEAIPLLDEAIPVLDDIAFVEEAPPVPMPLQEPSLAADAPSGAAHEPFGEPHDEHEGWPEQKELQQLVESLLETRLPRLKDQLREQLIEELRFRYPTLPWE